MCCLALTVPYVPAGSRVPWYVVRPLKRFVSCQREGERQREIVCECVCVCVCAGVCACVCEAAPSRARGPWAPGSVFYLLSYWLGRWLPLPPNICGPSMPGWARHGVLSRAASGRVTAACTSTHGVQGFARCPFIKAHVRNLLSEVWPCIDTHLAVCGRGRLSVAAMDVHWMPLTQPNTAFVQV